MWIWSGSEGRMSIHHRFRSLWIFSHILCTDQYHPCILALTDWSIERCSLSFLLLLTLLTSSCSQPMNKTCQGFSPIGKLDVKLEQCEFDKAMTAFLNYILNIQSIIMDKNNQLLHGSSLCYPVSSLLLLSKHKIGPISTWIHHRRTHSQYVVLIALWIF